MSAAFIFIEFGSAMAAFDGATVPAYASVVSYSVVAIVAALIVFGAVVIAQPHRIPRKLRRWSLVLLIGTHAFAAAMLTISFAFTLFGMVRGRIDLDNIFWHSALIAMTTVVATTAAALVVEPPDRRPRAATTCSSVG